MQYGTGFFGFLQLSDKPSVVLVTNHHVIGSEDGAAKSFLEFESVDIRLQLKELLVKATYIYSDEEKVTLLIVRVCCLRVVYMLE